MKKLSLVLVMVFAVCMVMAQKTTWVTQSGFGNTANITQSACVSHDATSIYATQSGTWNTLNTDQAGGTNYLELLQSGDNNKAIMKQSTCNVNNPGPGSFTNTANVTQLGTSNSANLTQKEADTDGWDFSINKATATQSGNTNSYLLSQGGNAWKPINEQYLLQSGDGNSADVKQKGYTNYSEIRQYGDWNLAGLDQNDAAMNSLAIWDKSYSWQLGGTSNMLNINQHGNPGLQYAESIQNSNASTTNIKQLSWGQQDVVSQQLGTNDILNVNQSN